MKKIFYSTLMSLAMTTVAFGQELLDASMYSKNLMLINPAYSGYYNNFFAAIQYNSLSGAVEHSPSQFSFNAHGPVNDYFNAGIQVVSIEAGFLKRTGVDLTSSYVATFNEHQSVTFGLSGGLTRRKFDQDMSAFNSFVNLDDPILQQGFLDETVFRMGGGFIYRYKDFELSFAMPQLMEGDENLKQNYQVFASYNIHSQNGSWLVKPSVFVASLENSGRVYDVNVLAEWRESIWFQTGYRSNGLINLSIGTVFDQIQLGYSFGYATGDMSAISTGRHEIMVALLVNR